MSPHLPRTSPLQGHGDGDLTLLSWNLLAPAWAKPVEYSHVAPDVLSWAHRYPLILRELERSAAAVLCLQEVEFQSYEDELLPALQALGYEGAVQSDRKRSPQHPAGNATFWQKTRFSLVGAPLTRSRTLAVVLRDGLRAGGSGDLAVLNCHLEGDPRSAVARVKQLQTGLQQLSGIEHHGVVVAGDFNCDLRSSAAAAYLAFGSVPLGVTEWGREVPPESSEIPGHGYGLASAYGMAHGLPTPFMEHAGNTWESFVPSSEQWAGTDLVDEFSFTIRGARGRCWMLDQLWFTTASLELLATRSAFADSEHRQAILLTGLPSPTEPSDHLPLAASFRWAAAPLPDLGAAKANAAPVAAPEALANEAAELFACCPLTEEQRQEWLEVTRPPPELPKGKKPSPEQLVEIKELQRRKEALLASVCEEARAILIRCQQLSRKARKQ